MEKSHEELAMKKEGGGNLSKPSSLPIPTSPHGRLTHFLFDTGSFNPWSASEQLNARLFVGHFF